MTGWRKELETNQFILLPFKDTRENIISADGYSFRKHFSLYLLGFKSDMAVNMC